MVEGIICKALAASSTITNVLATYNNAPAIIAGDRLPSGIKFPAILVSSVSSRGDDCRDSKGDEIIMDVIVYHDRENFSNKSLRDIATTVSTFLHHLDAAALFTEKGFENCGVYCDAPIYHPDPDGFPGYRMALKVSVLATA